MNLPAVLVVQSIPFAGLVLARRSGEQDLFAVLYIASVGLLMSAIAWFGDPASFEQVVAAVAELDGSI